MDMEKDKKPLFYLYCITSTKPPYAVLEEIDAKITPIYFQGTYAITSRVLSDEFNENALKKNLTDIKWVEKKVRLHEAIIEKFMKNSAVLPFKFATVFKSQENVEKLLKEHSAEYKKILENLAGKEEQGIKIYCSPGSFQETLAKEDERIRDLDKQITSAGKGKAYFLKKKKERLVKEIVNQKISEYTQDSFTRLKKVCLEAKINKILPREVTEKEDEMVFNAAFLINEHRIKDLENVLLFLRAKYSNKGLTFEHTGPWPPYNFCEAATHEAKGS